MTESVCPCCGSEPGTATFSTAPSQSVCSNGDCPVNTWDESVETPAGGSATHRKWRCPDCDAEVWVPIGALGSQHDHAQRVFCGCDVQGIRMVAVNGPDGRVEL